MRIGVLRPPACAKWRSPGGVEWLEALRQRTLEVTGGWVVTPVETQQIRHAVGPEGQGECNHPLSSARPRLETCFHRGRVSLRIVIVVDDYCQNRHW